DLVTVGTGCCRVAPTGLAASQSQDTDKDEFHSQDRTSIYDNSTGSAANTISAACVGCDRRNRHDCNAVWNSNARNEDWRGIASRFYGEFGLCRFYWLNGKNRKLR